jgi:hypothetical protein
VRRSGRSHNPKVAGSNPAPATGKPCICGAFCFSWTRRGSVRGSNLSGRNGTTGNQIPLQQSVCARNIRVLDPSGAVAGAYPVLFAQSGSLGRARWTSGPFMGNHHSWQSRRRPMRECRNHAEGTLCSDVGETSASWSKAAATLVPRGPPYGVDARAEAQVWPLAGAAAARSGCELCRSHRRVDVTAPRDLTERRLSSAKRGAPLPPQPRPPASLLCAGGWRGRRTRRSGRASSSPPERSTRLPRGPLGRAAFG